LIDLLEIERDSVVVTREAGSGVLHSQTRYPPLEQSNPLSH
jgi:hypothetical protein